MKTLAHMQAERLLFSRITYFNVGLFGEMLALTLPLLLALLLAHRNGYLRLNRTVLVLLVAAVPIDVASLFLSFTKSAYLAAAVGCLVLLLLFVHSWRRRAAILVTVTILSATVIPWPALVLQAAPPLNQAYRNVMVTVMGESRFDSWNPATAAGQGSLMERWYATEAGIQMALDHPLLGISLDQFGPQYISQYKPAQATSNLDWAHSMLTEVAAELGFPALMLDLVIYAAAMLAALRIYRSPPDQLTRLIACALLATMVSWQVMGLAFAGDMYRPWRNMASDYVVMMVLVASTFALYRISRAGRMRELPAA
jgi:ABC-type thiamin/hydroxymethylpyrimidine transport system permease subunit